MLIAATATAPAVELDLPRDFHAVPLERPTQERTAAQLHVLDDLAIVDVERREALSLYLEGLAARVAREGVDGAAFCAVRLEGRASTATLTVTVHRLGTVDLGVAVYAAAEALRAAGRFTSVTVEDLGTHLAVTAVADREVAERGAADPSAASVLREVLTVVPLAGTDSAVVLTLSTPCRDDWAVYADLARSVAASVRVRPKASPSERPRVAF